MPAKRLKKLHYGWVIVFAGFGICFINMIHGYSFGLFLKPLAEYFDTTRTVISGVRSVSGMIGAVMGLLTGRLTDKYGPRGMLMMLGIFSGAGFLLLSRVSTIWQVYFCYILTGLVTYQIPLFSTLTRWFSRKREIATGIVLVGHSVGGVVLIPVVQHFITDSGWRQAYLFIGAISVVFITLLALLVKKNPQQVGMQPYGADNPTMKKSAVADSEGLTLVQALRTARFWILGTLLFCFSWALTSIEVHLAPYATDINISPAGAANVVAVLAGFSMVGFISIGFLSEKKGVRFAVIVYLAIMTLSLVQLLLVRGLVPLYVFAIVFGIGHGGIVTVMASLTANLFGVKQIGSLFASVSCISAIGRVVGPVVSGNIFDRTGSYTLAFIICIIFAAVALVMSFALHQRKARQIPATY
jgi:MFS family permease